MFNKNLFNNLLSFLSNIVSVYLCLKRNDDQTESWLYFDKFLYATVLQS